MDLSYLTDPVLLSIFGKILKGAVILLLVVGFVPGVIVGWLFGRASS